MTVMQKFLFSLILFFALCSFVPVFAQEAAASDGSVAVATASAEDLAAMSNEELVAYLSSLSPDAFAEEVAIAVESGDHMLARRVIYAANKVIANASPEDADALVSAVDAKGGMIIVQNNVIRVNSVMPDSLLKKFDIPTEVGSSVSLPPVEPSYSAGANY